MMHSVLWWAPGLCLIASFAALFLALFPLERKLLSAISVALVGASTVAALNACRVVFLQTENAHETRVERYFNWLDSGEMHVDFALILDGFGTISALAVALFVLAMVVADHRTCGETTGLRHAVRISAWAWCGSAAMLLVLGSNFMLILVGGIGITVCSLVTAAIWPDESKSPTATGPIAYIGVACDLCLLAALPLIVKTLGTFDFTTWATAASGGLESGRGTLLTAAAILVCIAVTLRAVQCVVHLTAIEGMDCAGTKNVALSAASTLAGAATLIRCWPLIQSAPKWLQTTVWLVGSVVLLVLGLTLVGVVTLIRPTRRPEGSPQPGGFASTFNRIRNRVWKGHGRDLNTLPSVFDRVPRSPARPQKTVDLFLIDTVLINGLAFLVELSGDFLRFIQSGNVRNYALSAVLGVIILAAVLW